MDKTKTEFTEKIRSSIKEKLTEINAFVDDELPDYIMILVANKRSKSQIEKDLVLFLGNDTPAFTNWLWDLVKNLKVNSKLKSTSVPKKDIYKKKDTPSDEDADVLDYDLDEQESDILDQDDDIKNFPQGACSKTKTSNVSASSVLKAEVTASVSVVKGNPNLRQTNQEPAKVFPSREIRSVPVHSTAVPVQQQAVNPDNEYDPAKSDFSENISSVVHISQRRYGGPAALQANKLLLRAVSDATKSVLHGQNNNLYKPTPIKALSSNTKDDSTKFCNLVNVKTNSNFECSATSKEPESNNLDQTSNESELDALNSENYIFSSTSSNNRTICLTSDSTDLNVFEETSNFPFCSNNSQSLIHREERANSPHFIVTLDGVDFSLKRKYSETSDGSMEFEDEGTDDVSLVPEKKQKFTERCKYWPACKNSDDCVFHHPTVQCKCFPDCKYGDRCLYIHPNCKFDALCSRKDCPYTHASKRKFTPVPTKVQIKKRSPKAVCKFYPKCTVNKCPFVHPRLCRYGTKCRLPLCPYSHFNVPSRNQMKWKANV